MSYLEALSAAGGRPGDLKLPYLADGYGAIVADFPWKFSDQGSRATPGYRFMTASEIRDFPIPELAAPKSHLYLWVPDTHLRAALDCMEDVWGFAYKHQIVWGKVTAAGKPHFQLGHYWRKAHEVCLFGIRGKAAARDHATPSLVLAPRTRHSAKPEALQDGVERVSPGPYLELFARRRRERWTTWGAGV